MITDDKVARIANALWWCMFFGWPVGAVGYAYALGLAICYRNPVFIAVGVIGWVWCVTEFRNLLKLPKLL